MEHVILVNENDVEIGTMEKMEAHQKGVLHRAFSILIFNKEGDLLIHQRAGTKYHSSNLWTNTCCSHPRPGESIMEAAYRRLNEEMGIKTPLTIVDKFIYKAEFENGLIENELDYVLTGTYDGQLNINQDEIADYRFESIESILSSINKQPALYTHWFKIIIQNWNQKAA